jgi:hypothetical protein
MGSLRESAAALARACRPQKAARCRQLCLRGGAHDARRGRRRQPMLRGRLPRCRPEPARRRGAAGHRPEPARRRGAAGCTGRAAATERSPAGRASSSGRRAARGTQRRAQRAHAPERATAVASACAQRRGCLLPPGGEQSCAACPWPLAAVSATERGGALWCLSSEGWTLPVAPRRHALAVLFARRRVLRAADPLLQPGASCHARQNTSSAARSTANSTPSRACAQRAPARCAAGGGEARGARCSTRSTRAPRCARQQS